VKLVTDSAIPSLSLVEYVPTIDLVSAIERSCEVDSSLLRFLTDPALSKKLSWKTKKYAVQDSALPGAGWE